jgi:23S rRNA U2552 (ribose-2'-O)-methylase RlmE/FtsJ
MASAMHDQIATAELPAVVWVKKSSSRGCAVVFLRDVAVLERGVLQRVAVIDGVCVEIRRHSREAREGEAGALFVAWGVRVEKRVTVNPESIEDYFNGLAGSLCPEGLVARAPFREEDLRFVLSSDSVATLDSCPKVDVASKDKLLTGSFCDARLVSDLWLAKGRLDALWALPPPPMARSLMNRVARAQLFPHSGEGGSKENGENRAGDKLAELADLTGLLRDLPAGFAFLDLCGGPGAWSQFLLARHDLALRGFGLTLRAQSGSERDWHAQEKDEWYPELSRRSDWFPLWGKDGSGDLLKPGNLDHACRQLDSERVMLVVADGGFSDDSIPANLLELYFYRLFLGELLMAARVLQPGGRFVCKLYGSCSEHTAALLYCATRLFDDVSIVKPKSSKATGPERYLAAFGRKTGKEAAQIREALGQAHSFGGPSSPLDMPLLTPVVRSAHLVSDSVFMSSMLQMTSNLCDRNAKALNAVVDRAEFLEDMAMTVTDEVLKRTEKTATQCWPSARDNVHEEHKRHNQTTSEESSHKEKEYSHRQGKASAESGHQKKLGRNGPRQSRRTYAGGA